MNYHHKSPLLHGSIWIMTIMTIRQELWKELELDDIVGAEALARYHLAAWRV